ncbi:MAG: protein kinase, partial [Planctomycetes bacterium]|nr:protein kinase [Planctomycetota bacterium]
MTHSTDLGTLSDLPVNVSIPGYRLRRPVGQDAIGLWFDAEQESLERKVTLKILRPEYESHEGARREFFAEMDTLAPLDHPDILHVLHTDRGAIPVLVTERLPQDRLETMLRPAKPLGEQSSLQLARSIARAAEHLLEKGLAAKNLTPSLLATRTGGLRLITFRNVIRFEELVALKGKLAQDPNYVAPEQLAGEAPVGPQTPVYQVAAMLFHMLAGRAPHGPGLPKEVAKAHLTAEFPSLKRFQPFLSKGIYDLIAACTERDPAARPDLALLLESIDHILDGKAPPLESDGAGARRAR